MKNSQKNNKNELYSKSIHKRQNKRNMKQTQK